MAEIKFQNKFERNYRKEVKNGGRRSKEDIDE